MRLFAISAMIIAAILMVSCDSEDESEVIVDSELLDSGITPDTDIVVTTESNDSGDTKFSYNTWLDLDVTTKSTQRRVEIELTSSISCEAKYIEVNNFHYGDAGEITFNESVVGTYKSNVSDYVTITNNLLTVKIPYSNFDMEYYFYYQTATYNDGITAVEFPYKSFDKDSFATEGDATISWYDISTSNSYIYSQRKFTQQAKIKYGGTQYSVDPVRILKYLVSWDGTVAAVDCEITERYTVANETAGTTGTYNVDVRTIINTTEKMSDGTTTTETYNYEPAITFGTSNKLTEETYYVPEQYFSVTPPESLTATVSMSGDPDYTTHDGTTSWYQKVYIDCGDYGEYRMFEYSTKDFNNPFTSEGYLEIKPTSVSISSQNYYLEDAQSSNNTKIAWMYVTLVFEMENLEEPITFTTYIAAVYYNYNS